MKNDRKKYKVRIAVNWNSAQKAITIVTFDSNPNSLTKNKANTLAT